MEYILWDGQGFVRLVDRMQNDTALKVVQSARVSYQKGVEEYGEKEQRLAKFLWDAEHHSTYRHTYFTFHLSTPLFVFRQHVKYQVGSYWRTYEVDGQETSLEIFDHMFDTDSGTNWNEVSGRFKKLEPSFYFPGKLRTNTVGGNKQASEELEGFDHEAELQLMRAECEESYKKYEERLERGVARELARTLLPQNIMTEAYWTVSLQGVLHFLSQRLKPDAQKEIRDVALGVYDLVREDLDKLGIDFDIERSSHGIPTGAESAPP